MSVNFSPAGAGLPTTLPTEGGGQVAIKDLSTDALTEKLNSGKLDPKQAAAVAIELLNRAEAKGAEGAQGAGGAGGAGDISTEDLTDAEKKLLKELLQKLKDGGKLSDEDKAILKGLLEKTGMDQKGIDALIPPGPNEV